jgi:uncharacterized cupin superfamily protein
MSDTTVPSPVRAAALPPRVRRSNYPEPFASRMALREKRPLGELFGLRSFGVNLTRLAAGGTSSLMHRHSLQDEFVYIVEGRPTLVTEGGEMPLAPGMCVGFAAGGAAHCLVNRTEADVAFLEIGDRQAGDTVDYPADDIAAVMGEDGQWVFAHKDGTPY